MGGKVIFFKKFEGLEMRFSVKMNSSLLKTAIKAYFWYRNFLPIRLLV
jgi:hypothetical protein